MSKKEDLKMNYAVTIAKAIVKFCEGDEARITEIIAALIYRIDWKKVAADE